MKKYAKLLLVVACVAMVFAMSVGVSATEYGVTYDNDALVGTNAAIDVTVTIESADLGFTVIPVSLSSSTNNHTAIEALNSAAVSSAGYSFYYYDSDTQSYNALSTSNVFFNRVKYNNTYYDGTGNGYSGWQFRINGGFPQETVVSQWGTYVQGSSVVNAKIKDGDVIAIYVDDPASASASTRFTRATVESSSSNAVSVFVTESHQWYDSVFNWYHPDFTEFSGVTVNLYSGTGITSTPIATAVSDGDGYADFEFDSGSTLSPGTYTVKVCGNWNGTSPISSCISSFTISQ